MDKSFRAHFLAKNIVQWHRTHNERILPWKNTNDPYRIWLSEIMSHQTRIGHVLSYYKKFINRFPDIHSMAEADEDTILSMWSGLGYYNRARNMHKTATIVAEKYKGAFPHSYEEVRALPGIGDYTAAAICSFAYGQTYPVIDANVERIYARFNAVAENLKRKAAKSEMLDFLDMAIAGENPADFNQSMMDFGAFVCKPRDPDCENCPLNKVCKAYLSGAVNLFPVKPQKKVKRKRVFHYLVLRKNDILFLRKRNTDDIWANMWEFPLIESKTGGNLTSELIGKYLSLKNQNYLINDEPALYAQTLSHQKIEARFYELEIGGEEKPDKSLEAVNIKELDQKAFPGVIREYLRKEFQIKF